MFHFLVLDPVAFGLPTPGAIRLSHRPTGRKINYQVKQSSEFVDVETDKVIGKMTTAWQIQFKMIN
jgi:hypothetical protein